MFDQFYCVAEFHKLGGLEAILNILKHFPDPHFRGSASNVVATLLWDNPQSRRLFMEAKGFEALFSIFSSDMDTDIRKHALEAIFCKCYFEILELRYLFC